MLWIEAKLAGIALAVSYVILLCLVFCYQDALVFPGSYLPMDGPQAKSRVACETVELPGGRTCRLYTSQPKAPRGVIVWFVGNGEAGDRCAYWADSLARLRNCTVLSVEYPGYAKGGGRATKTACLDAAAAAADRAQALARRSDLPLLVGGHSLGTFMAAATAARGVGDRLILVSPPASIGARGQDMFPFLPVRALLLHDFDNLETAPAIRCPTLVIHGRQDRIVPIREGRLVADRIRSAQWLEIPDGTHDPIGLLARGGDVLARFLRPR